MQSSSPRPSEMQTKASPSVPNRRRNLSPSLRRGSPASSNSAESPKPSPKVYDRKSTTKSQYFQQKQRSVRDSDTREQLGKLQEDLRKTKDKKFHALGELQELMKKKDEETVQLKDMIKKLETEADKANESEGKMLESLFSQTKKLEETKILLEEAKLEIRNLQESSHIAEKNGSLESIWFIEETRKLRIELRLALLAEQRSKKAMDDLAIALKEVTVEANEANLELALTNSELQKANSLAQSTEQKLKDALKQNHELKLDCEKSSIVWKEKEDYFVNCMKIYEDDMSRKDREICRLNDAEMALREEASKLREIIKHAVNEASVTKDSLELARYENYELEKQLSKKDNELQKIKQDYERIKYSEAAAIDSVRELKKLLASVSVAGSKKSSNLIDFGSFRESKAAIDDRKISSKNKKFSSDRWTGTKTRAQNGGRKSDVLDNWALDKEEDYVNKNAIFGSVSNVSEIGLPSFLLSYDRGMNTDDFDRLDGMAFSDADNMKKMMKKKKTALERFGDMLMGKSFRKP